MLGLCWPIEAAHSTMKIIHQLLPISTTVIAARHISSSYYSFTRAEIWLGFIGGIAWNVILFYIMRAVLERDTMNISTCKLKNKNTSS